MLLPRQGNRLRRKNQKNSGVSLLCEYLTGAGSRAGVDIIVAIPSVLFSGYRVFTDADEGG